MKFTQGLFIFLFTVIAAICMYGAEYILLGPLVVLISESFYFHLLLSLLGMLIINPMIIYRLIQRLDLKPHNLKVDKGLDEHLRQEVEIEELQ